MSRVCTKCKTEKPFADFCQDKAQKNGHRPSCKMCNAKSVEKSCKFCGVQFVGGKNVKHCSVCVATKSDSELYRVKKPISKCATCDKMARSSQAKYCEKCLEENTRKQKREWITNKRETDPDFVEKERIYLKNYCEGKGITLVDLWGDILGNRSLKEEDQDQEQEQI